MTIFDQAHPKITESTFSFPEFVPANNQFIPSVHFWDKGQSESSLTSLATLIFDHTHQKIFGQLLILWICINMQKISYCICSFYLSVNSMCLYICSFSYSNCSVTSLAKPIFDYTHPCICSFYLSVNSIFSYICSFSYSNCSVTSLAKPIFDYAHINKTSSTF